MQDPSSIVASGLKFNAAGSVHPGTSSYLQDPSSIVASGSKFNALGSVHPNFSGFEYSHWERVWLDR